MSKPSRRGPRPLSEILGELFTVRGYGRLRARQELEDAWNAAVGEPYCRQTRLGEVRRGVLNVTVDHSALLEELAAFRKPALLAALRSGAPATMIHDIRFRVGAVAVADKVEPSATAASPPPAAAGGAGPAQKGRPAPPRAGPGSRSKPGRGSGPTAAQP
jgi:predicted nucleic acid-binding Zn ribbon protein